MGRRAPGPKGPLVTSGWGRPSGHAGAVAGLGRLAAATESTVTLTSSPADAATFGGTDVSSAAPATCVLTEVSWSDERVKARRYRRARSAGSASDLPTPNTRPSERSRSVSTASNAATKASACASVVMSGGKIFSTF